jgi:hypothetical protein
MIIVIYGISGTLFWSAPLRIHNFQGSFHACGANRQDEDRLDSRRISKAARAGIHSSTSITEEIFQGLECRAMSDVCILDQGHADLFDMTSQWTLRGLEIRVLPEVSILGQVRMELFGLKKQWSLSTNPDLIAYLLKKQIYKITWSTWRTLTEQTDADI